jgi:GntR family transcriptional regulator, galactonate operon transcriptional repressor
VTATSSHDGQAALPAWPRRPARLGTAVVDALVDRVVSGELAPGTLLPIEPRLCEAFSVSRTVIREAVKILEQKGLVHIKQGQGTRVAMPDEWNLLDPVVLEASVRHDLYILDDLVEVRRVLESDMAGQAAVRVTAADRADMRRLLDQLAVEVATPDRHMLTDLEFHDVIMRASGNRLGRAIVRTIQSEARASDRYKGYPRRADCEASNRGHIQIYDCIVAADAEGAAAAMSEHILGSWLARRREPEPRSQPEGPR